MKKLVLVLLMSLMLTSLSACGSVSVSTSSDTSISKAGVSDSKAVSEGWNKVDKTVTIEDISYTVNAYTFSKGSDFFEAEEGKTYCKFDITVKNDTNEASAVSSLMMFDLNDADGNAYDLSLVGLATLEEDNIEQLDGDVPAASEFRGGIVFEIPENSKGLTLTIKGLLSGEEKVSIN